MFLFNEIIWFYILAAILPAVILLVYVYQKDTVEKEPGYLIGRLLLSGVLAALGAMILENIGESLLSRFISPENPYYTMLLAFLVVAAAEEGMKFLLMKRATWRDPNFNYRFDGIVYAVTVSLGFAAFENILYVFGYGLSVAPARAVTAIPGHLSFAVFMGYFYGRAKLCEGSGRPGESAALLWLSWLVSVFLHGFYDACAMKQTALSSTVFTVFIVVLFIVVYFLIRRESNTDEPV